MAHVGSILYLHSGTFANAYLQLRYIWTGIKSYDRSSQVLVFRSGLKDLTIFRGSQTIQIKVYFCSSMLIMTELPQIQNSQGTPTNLIRPLLVFHFVFNLFIVCFYFVQINKFSAVSNKIQNGIFSKKWKQNVRLDKVTQEAYIEINRRRCVN